MKANKSFEERLVGLQSNLLNFAYQLTTDREQAEDLLQDTTLKALSNEDKYVDNVNFKGWIFTIMRNIFMKQAPKPWPSGDTPTNFRDSVQPIRHAAP